MGKTAKTRTRVEWLTRRQVAEILGIDEPRIEAMDGREFRPIRRADRSWLYDPRQVASVFLGRAPTGELTARLFSLFRDGTKNLPDIAIETQQPASRIRELRAEYDELAGMLTLDRATVDGLAQALGKDAVTDGAKLLAAVRSQLDVRFREGFAEGRADASDFGEVVNPETGERRRLTRS